MRLRVRARPGVCALAAALLCAVPAAARAASPAYVELHDAQGKLVAASAGSGYDAPEDGSAVHVGAAIRTATGIELADVTLLGGRVRASRIAVPDRGTDGVVVADLVVDGISYGSEPNTIVNVPGIGYLLANQQASDGEHDAVVGLRLHVTSGVDGLPAGSELLIAPAGSRVGDPAVLPSSSPITTLGFRLALAPTTIAVPTGYPLAQRGVIRGCAFVAGSTHSPFASPFNLESDDAIDIYVAYGTPVLAVADGVIGDRIGSLGSSDPAMAGLRLHLETAGHRYYYAHLSRIDVQAGQHVRAGQVLGLSGRANGVDHLHFAQDGGNPAVTVGEPQACPGFTQYDEPW